MDEAGLTAQVLIEKYLVPLLNAKTKKFFQYQGKVTAQRDVPALDVRLNALDMVFRLLGSYTPRDQEKAEQIGGMTVIVDVPRPDRSRFVASGEESQAPGTRTKSRVDHQEHAKR
jgi:hypothetical protein